MSSTSLYDLLADVPVQLERSERTRLQRSGETAPSVIDGLNPRRAGLDRGLVTLSPEELLTIKIAPVSVNGRVVGYQRDLKVVYARDIAKALLRGVVMPPINLAIDGHGILWAVDGQHRAAGAIIARTPIKAVVQELTRDEQKSMFLSQRSAKPVGRDILTLAGTDPIARYVQQAVTTNANAWSNIVSANRHSKTRITPYSAYQLLLRYVYNVEGQAASYKHNMEDHWDVGLADQLAPLIACFGNKQTNPLAFRPTTVQSIGAAAMWVFRRNTPLSTDYDRWVTHMPSFKFGDWAHISTQMAKTDVVLDHWNKRLTKTRRVVRSRGQG
ncbi:MAG: hypothetical protein H0W81_06420 [Chloroflexi bacterium]|nr:hypothetical protein [Chloroflexota bacterium]